DRYDKRKLLVYSQSAVFTLAAINALLVHTGVVQVWHLAVLGLLQGVAMPFTMPTRTALVPDLVPDNQVPNALALESTGRNINRVVTPALAGVLLAWNPAFAFDAIAISYGLAVLTLINLPRGLRGSGERQGTFAEIAYGFRYIFSNAPLFALLALAYIPILLGMPFQSLLPVFQQDVLSVGETALGIMYTATGLGAITGSIVIAYLADTPNKNRLQIASGIAFGLTLAAFAISTNYLLSVLLLAVVGFASTGYLTLNRVLVAERTERAVFGRVMSIYGMTWSLMPVALLPYGALVDIFGVQATVASGGLLMAAVVAGIAIKFAHYYLETQLRTSATD
ncbi:MAG: MFS transporter, partial [Chloroflexota bacterium]